MRWRTVFPCVDTDNVGSQDGSPFMASASVLGSVIGPFQAAYQAFSCFGVPAGSLPSTMRLTADSGI